MCGPGALLLRPTASFPLGPRRSGPVRLCRAGADGRLARRLPYRVHRERLRWPTKKAGCKSLILPEPAAGQKKDRRDPIPTAGVAGISAVHPPGSSFPAAGPVWGFMAATSVCKMVAMGASFLRSVASVSCTGSTFSFVAHPNRGIVCQTPKAPEKRAMAPSIFRCQEMPAPKAE